MKEDRDEVIVDIYIYGISLEIIFIELIGTDLNIVNYVFVHINRRENNEEDVPYLASVIALIIEDYVEGYKDYRISLKIRVQEIYLTNIGMRVVSFPDLKAFVKTMKLNLNVINIWTKDFTKTIGYNENVKVNYKKDLL